MRTDTRNVWKRLCAGVLFAVGLALFVGLGFVLFARITSF